MDDLTMQLLDNINARIDQLSKMQETTAKLISELVAEHKLHKENIVKLADNSVAITENIPRVLMPFSHMSQALMEDYISQIAILSGQSEEQVSERLIHKIQTLKAEAANKK